MKHSKEEMSATLISWRDSGLSKKAFCSERNISYQTFQYWCKRLSAKDDPGFLEVNLAGHRQGVIELTFPSGARMTFQGQPSATWLRELVG